jgi:battenin
MLFIVYFFEYCIITGFAQVIRERQEMNKLGREDIKFDKLKGTTNVDTPNCYIIINISYQIGVFISRSSLSYMKIPSDKLYILVLLQFFNFIFFFLDAKYLFLDNIFCISILSIWVGLMGGGAYVNIFHALLKSDKVKQSEKEIATSLALIFNSLGIVVAALFSIVVQNTVLADPDQK